MITARDVQTFMEKCAEEALSAPVEVKPAASATGSPGIGGRIAGLGGKLMSNPMNALMWGSVLYGAAGDDGQGGGILGSYRQYDKNREAEAQLAQAIPQINTLTKKNPDFTVANRNKTPYQKDLNEYGLTEANFRNFDRDVLKQKAQYLDATARNGSEDTQADIPLKDRDYTQLGAFQRANKTTTVPSRERYQRG